ncbi:MAG: putative zinc-binding metallopeptidase [Candidatus Omnitrophota bacterium]
MRKTKAVNLDKLSDEGLLALRFCDLPIKIEGTPLEEYIGQFYGELADKGIGFHPHCYLADEWLCPDGDPVIGIAFFLAHPRLKKLEHKMMLEVEGGDKPSCMRLLRHEMGHAINYAYLLHRRKRWQKIFGLFSVEYGESYKYRPYSKSFVRHLEDWYAQYHPDEDFAETFAVWLDPESNWKERYKGWKALKKLEYVDELMKEIASKAPKKARGEKFWAAARLKTTLRTYYKRKRKLYEKHYADFHDFHLNKIFFANEPKSKRKKAHKLIREHRKKILNHVALWTGEKKFIINGLLKDLVERSKELGLEAGPDEAGTILEVAVYVTAQIMNYLYAGGYKRRK